MRAAQISEYGGADKIAVVDVQKPNIRNDQVLLEAFASSLNPFDTKVREGHLKDAMPALPYTLGGDVAGTVVEVGSAVKNFAVGDRVYGQANVIAGNSGAFAEFVATAAGQVAKIPESLDFSAAASLALAGVSALQGLTEHIALHQGARLFIHGGSGGIGSLAIQIAKANGAYVATTATGDGIEYVKQLGADEVVDYKSEDFAEILKDFDAVFDTVGQNDFVKSLAVLKSGGVAVSMIAAVDETVAVHHGITAYTQSTHVTTAALDELSQLVVQGNVKALVSQTFALADIADAFKTRETQSVQGKIVITIK